jgi:Ca2+:H+ antiporter
LATFAAALLLPASGPWVLLYAAALVGSVIAAVHHAEVIAHRVGEPFGTLVLALAITAIELSLILSVVVSAGAEAETLTRDTIYATVMIIASGVVGLCVIAGGLRHGELTFRGEGRPRLRRAGHLAVLVLVLPVYTVSEPGAARYSPSQLGFAAISSLALWCVFVFFQTVRHRDYFLTADSNGDEDAHAPLPAAREAALSFALLLVSLVAVVGLAKTLSPTIEAGVDAAGAPRAVIGIAIAMLVLAPEASAAMRAALANRFSQREPRPRLGAGDIGLRFPPSSPSASSSTSRSCWDSIPRTSPCCPSRCSSERSASARAGRT